MRLCIRLAVMSALLVTVAMGLIWLRTDTVQAGNRLHVLFRQKQDLEKECYHLEEMIAQLKNQERLRSHAATFGQDTVEDAGSGPKSSPRGAGGAPAPQLVERAGRG
jgi:hypothetical protein